MAKILGGKGDYGVQFGYYGMLMAPVIVINAVLTFVPIVGGLVGLLVALYALYLLTISIKEAHQLDTSKAVLAWLIPAIVISIVAMIIFGAAVMSMGGLGALGARRF
ncbi:MAG: YIP1 family protein, partial [Candidatus Micrarchaeia archaeon]